MPFAHLSTASFLSLSVWLAILRPLTSALSTANDSSWIQAQSQLGYDQANQTYGRQTGVTLFPIQHAISAPQGCIHGNGSVNGYTPLDYGVSPLPIALSTDHNCLQLVA